MATTCFNGGFYKLIVVGCGASGLLFSRLLMEKLRKLPLNKQKEILAQGFLQLESEEVVGKKILATGNGRCNVLPAFFDDKNFHTGNREKFIKLTKRVAYTEIKDFFHNLGLEFYKEDDRLYPRSMQAQSVLDVLDYNREDFLGLKLKLKNIVKKITYNESTQNYHVLVYDEKQKHVEYTCEYLILGAGGLAGQAKGKSDMQLICQDLDLDFVPWRPALTTFEIAGMPRELAGIRSHAKLSLLRGKYEIYTDELASRLIPETSEEGELLFTEYGLSGIPTMNISRHYHDKEEQSFLIDLLPDISLDKLFNILQKEATNKVNKHFLTGILPLKIVRFMLKHYAKLYSKQTPQLGQKIASVFKNDFLPLPTNCLKEVVTYEFAYLLKHFVLPIKYIRNYNFAQLTAGGVDLSNLKENTLESKTQAKLYFMGEILDVDARCGGNNLYWAWLTAYICMKDIEEKLC